MNRRKEYSHAANRKQTRLAKCLQQNKSEQSEKYKHKRLATENETATLGYQQRRHGDHPDRHRPFPPAITKFGASDHPNCFGKPIIASW